MTEIRGKQYTAKEMSLNGYCLEVYGTDWNSGVGEGEDTVFIDTNEGEGIREFFFTSGTIESEEEEEGYGYASSGISIISDYTFYFPVESIILYNKEE